MRIRVMASDAPTKDPIVQYIVLRKDLWKSEGWPLGSVAAQACHASTAALWIYKYDPVTLGYTQDLDNTTKVVLEAKSLEQIQNLSQKLDADEIFYKLWIEQPKNFATCFAAKPYAKSQIAHYFKKLSLC